MNKYVFVTGGVCSSLGKGITAASLGNLLESRGYKIQMVKIDPYINVDAGTMSPYQHGEVYVTDDGAETDLDLGNYARFTHAKLSRDNSITTGQVYQEVITREREGRYLGRTVQVIPHITDRIQQRIMSVGEDPEVDLTIIEVGGTVGDIESVPFLEAARQMIHEYGNENIISIHLTLVPEVSGGELKTKPTQHSVKELMTIGIQPDLLICRTPYPLPEDMRRKIALFTNVRFDAVFYAHDVETSIYEVPLHLHNQGMDEMVLNKLAMDPKKPDVRHWERILKVIRGANRTVKIGMVGKYIELGDTYKSIDEALHHAAIANGVALDLIKIDSEALEKKDPDYSVLDSLDGILVPGGFGSRGVNGMVEAARWSRSNDVPYFGICLGMQVMVIEYARNVLNLETASSTEFVPECEHPVVSLLEEQIDVKNYGGTMRLGRSESKLFEGSKIARAYGSTSVYERHRHRYEVSNKYRDQLDAAGLKIAGTTPNGELVESVSWDGHPWGIGVQYHPEFNSRPTEPHPLFTDFIKNCVVRIPAGTNKKDGDQ